MGVIRNSSDKAYMIGYLEGLLDIIRRPDISLGEFTITWKENT